MLHAQQLAVLGYRLAAFHPRGDVVGLHFPVRLLPVLLHAMRADATLALIDLPLHGIVEGPLVQELLVSGPRAPASAPRLLPPGRRYSAASLRTRSKSRPRASPSSPCGSWGRCTFFGMHLIGFQEPETCILSDFKKMFSALYRNSDIFSND